MDAIVPALSGIDGSLAPEEALSRAVEANVRWTVRQIAESPEGRTRVAEGVMRLVGAIYDIRTGRVRLLE